MLIKWKEKHPTLGVSGFAAVGSLELYVVPLRAGLWAISVDDANTGKALASDDEFSGTFDEAKARAIALGLGTLSPWVEIARAEGAAQEREVCLSELRKLAEKRDAMAENSEAPDFYRSQAAVLRIVEDAIRARNDGGK